MGEIDVHGAIETGDARRVIIRDVAYFIPTDEGLQPVPEARSPWSADMLHGRLLSGLAARAVELDFPDAHYRVARLTLDMFRFPPMQPFTATTRVARDGRRVRAVDVSITCAGVEVARASVLLLRTGTHPEATVWQPDVWHVPAPEELEPPPEMADSGWEIRLVSEGGFWSDARKQAWSRDGWSLVEGEEMSPLVRVAIASDLPNPMANSGPEGLQFINPDLTMFLAREPTSEWIGLDVTGHVGADGIAIGTCALYDLKGPIGYSTVCGLANEVLAPNE
ncbi:MAG TPA: thioesterase family protein [Acidimicrobiales bacterium]|nr:thioesterase family protein [Acidimicrobiales bacterium]